MSNYIRPFMIISHLATDGETVSKIHNWIYEEHDGDLRYAFEAGFDVCGDEYVFDGVNDVNWSLDDREMYEFSKAFPEALIEVHYSNGYIEDEERDYWQNGKRTGYTPDIVWPEFNPNDLMEVFPDGNA